jgi:hypothetical protein
MMDTLTARAKKSWKFLIILAILGGLYGSYPYIAARVVAGGSWQGVVPKFSGDAMAYMTRANAAIHGEFGNPYYTTNYDNPSPSLTIVDSILGIPYAFFSPFGALLWNTFLWSALLAFLLGVLLLWMGYSRWVIIVSWLILSNTIFWFMLRPGHTQILYPYFLLFFILLLRAWHRDRSPTMGKYDYLTLGLCAGLTPYIYTFLFQVVAASLLVGVVFSLLLRRMQLMRSLVSSIMVMIVCIIPYLVYFQGVSGLPAFAETMNDFLGIRSHFPSPQLYFYGRWLMVVFAWAFLLWWTYRKETNREAKISKAGVPSPSLENVTLTIATVSLATFGAMGENIVTGIDIAGPSHVNFFVYIIVSLGLILFIPPTVRVLSRSGSFVQKIPLLLCALLVVGRVAVMIPEQFPNPTLYRVDRVTLEHAPDGNFQYIMPALTAIRSLPGSHVIAAPKFISGYIPLYTGQHVLFDSYGRMYVVGTIASVERLLTAQLGQPLSSDDMLQVLQSEAFSYAEPENSEIVARNRLARELCTAAFHLSPCSTLVVAQLFTDDGIIDRSVWLDYYQTAIGPHPLKYLKRFHVSQVVIDRRLATPEFLRAQTPWYSDQYYAIYDITNLLSS